MLQQWQNWLLFFAKKTTESSLKENVALYFCGNERGRCLTIIIKFSQLSLFIINSAQTIDNVVYPSSCVNNLFSDKVIKFFQLTVNN